VALATFDLYSGNPTVNSQATFPTKMASSLYSKFNGLVQVIYQDDLRFILLCNESKGSWCIELGAVSGAQHRWWRHRLEKTGARAQVRIDDMVSGIIAGELFIVGWNGNHNDTLTLSILPTSPRPIPLPLEAYTQEESDSKAEELLFQIAIKAGNHGSRLWSTDGEKYVKREQQHAEEVTMLKSELERSEEMLSTYKDHVKRLEGELLRYGPPPKRSSVKKLVMMPKHVPKAKSGGAARMDFNSDSDQDMAQTSKKRAAPTTDAKVSPNNKRTKPGPSRKKAPVPTSKDFETDND